MLDFAEPSQHFRSEVCKNNSLSVDTVHVRAKCSVIEVLLHSLLKRKCLYDEKVRVAAHMINSSVHSVSPE